MLRARGLQVRAPITSEPVRNCCRTSKNWDLRHESRPASTTQARFVTGSTLRHVTIMTLTGALGLMSMFLVNLADLFFLSMLQVTEVTAAIGYAGTIVFSNLSVSLGTGIAAAALVARNLGLASPTGPRVCHQRTDVFHVAFGGDHHRHRDRFGIYSRSTGEHMARRKRLAQLFIWTLTPGYILISGAVCCSFILRGLGDAKRAMYITLSSAIITAIFDPIFIFGFGWGIQGAAAANVMGYLVSFGIGIHGVSKVHGFINPMRVGGPRRDLPAIWAIAFPAIPHAARHTLRQCLCHL